LASSVVENATAINKGCSLIKKITPQKCGVVRFSGDYRTVIEHLVGRTDLVLSTKTLIY